MSAAPKAPRGGRAREKLAEGERASESEDAHDAFGPEPSTADRLAEMRAAAEVLDGVLREARRLRSGLRKRIDGEHALAKRLALVADDVEDTREMLALALREAGFRVLLASDGCEAVDLATAWLPDIVVIDYAMPRMDGGEAVRRLADDPRTLHIPALMISAYADELPREVRLMCAAFLPKPCDPEDVARVVHLVLDARAPVP